MLDKGLSEMVNYNFIFGLTWPMKSLPRYLH